MTQSGTGPQLLARFSRIPVTTRSHRRWAILLAGVFVFELADLHTFALVAPELRKQWHLSVASIGLITSLGFVGMFLGSAIGGRLSDAYGRKKPLIWSSIWFSIFSALSALATDLATLGVLRILTGVGLTSMTAIALSYVSEMYPRDLRGRYLALIFGVGLSGIPLISWFARAVVPAGTDGWRWVFLVGGLGIVVAALMIKYLPESIRWQIANGTGEQAESLVAQLEREAVAKLGTDLPEPEIATETPAARGGLRELFGPQYRRRTIVFFIASIFAVVGFYGYTSFVPTLLVEHGFDVVHSLTYTSIVQLGAIPGAFLAFTFTDRWERKYSLGISYLSITALVLVYGYADEAGVIVVTGFLIAMLLQTSTVLAFTYGPEIFPTELRGLGGGLGNGLGRLATAGGSNLLPVIFTTFGYTAVFIYVGVVLAITAIAYLGWGERTTGRALETVTVGPRNPAAPTPQERENAT
ncbi:MFS transporter [Nocardia pseudovaccinii]|uniref:MFS transporter n=1 Tax=Nocardia pseudovaccinii TaxID=189540 RepID=UPI0007C693AD|nr:MFS transporter [Nocardia pseudovaccinii]